MPDAVIVAILALVGNVVVSWISNSRSAALIAYRIDQLEEKVNKHNELISRTYNLEKHMAIVEKEVEKLEAFHKDN